MSLSPRAVLALLSGVLLLGCASSNNGGAAYVPRDDGPQVTAKDSAQSDPDLIAGTDISAPDVNEEPEDDRLQLACGANLKKADAGDLELGDFIMGATCEEHSDCASGFCYDGGYLGWDGGLKFCTLACGGCAGAGYQCSDFNGDGPEYWCLRLPSCHSGDHPVREFCIPGCSVEGINRCNEWFGEGTYLDCAYASTKECGNIGASKACIVPEP